MPQVSEGQSLLVCFCILKLSHCTVPDMICLLLRVYLNDQELELMETYHNVIKIKAAIEAILKEKAV